MMPQPYQKKESPTFKQSYEQQEKLKFTPSDNERKSPSPIKHQQNISRSTKINNMISNLFRKHDEMKKHVEQLRKQKEAEYQKQLQKYEYIPKITHSKRYKPSGTFQSRNQNLIKDRKEFREEESQKKQKEELKPCPFSPELIARKRSTQILERKKLKQQGIDELRNPTGRQESFRLQMSESRKKCSKSPSGKQTLSALKNLIKGELRRIDLL